MRTCSLTTIAAAAILGSAITLAQADDRSGRNDSWWPDRGMGYMEDGHMMGRGYGNMMGRGYGSGSGYAHMMGPRHGSMMGYGYSRSTDRIDGRLAFIKAELKITAEQEEAWSKFADALRTEAESHVRSMESMMESMHGDDYLEQSLPERLALHETHMEERVEQLRTLQTAVGALYEQLGDEQKETADEIVMPMMGMGHGMGMHMGRGRMRR